MINCPVDYQCRTIPVTDKELRNHAERSGLSDIISCFQEAAP